MDGKTQKNQTYFLVHPEGCNSNEANLHEAHSNEASKGIFR